LVAALLPFKSKLTFFTTASFSSSTSFFADNMIIEGSSPTLQFFNAPSGYFSSAKNCLIIKGRLGVAGPVINIQTFENLTFLNWDNSAGATTLGNFVGIYYRNIFIRKTAGAAATPILTTPQSYAEGGGTGRYIGDIQSIIFEVPSDAETALISFGAQGAIPAKTYRTSTSATATARLDQDTGSPNTNQLVLDTQFEATVWRRVEAYLPAHARSISSNINLDTGAHKPNFPERRNLRKSALRFRTW